MPRVSTFNSFDLQAAVNISMLRNLLSDMGLVTCQPFLADRQFSLALLAGPVMWMGLWIFVPDGLTSLKLDKNVILLLSLIMWQPVVEELFFRGVVQGQLMTSKWGIKVRWGFTYANLLTSMLFVLAHALYHPPLWAFAVFVPSLIFGFFRDRFGSIYPAMFLHVFYNAGFFLLGAFKIA